MFAFSGSTPSPSLNRAVLVSGNLVRAVIRTGLEPVSPYSAAAFRIVFGLLVLVAVVRFAANGWISQLYVDPAYHFSYYGFGWVQPWPAWGMYLHFALLGLASLGVMLGYRYRLSIVAFFLLFTYVQLIDRTTYLNHYYLVSLLSLAMIFLPLNRVASLDSRRRSKGEALPAIPRGVLWLLMAQIGLVYVFGGLAKLNPDWLLHAQPLRIWLYNATDVPLIGSLFREEWMAYAISWGGAMFDLTIAGWLLWRKTRTWAYGVLVLFHLATALLFPALGMFPWLMIGLTLVFFAPDWPLKFASKMTRRSALPQTSFVAHRQQPGLESRERMASIAIAAAAVFLLVQVALPSAPLCIPRQRALDRGRLSFRLAHDAHGKDGAGGVSGQWSLWASRDTGSPRRILDAVAG